jgi:ankyrin repeat protein
MIQKKYLFLAFTTVFSLALLKGGDKTKKTEAFHISTIGMNIQEMLTFFLTAIINEDLETIELCLDQNPALIETIFEKKINFYTKTDIIEKNCIINPLIFAIINSKFRSIDFLLEHGAHLNKKINRIPPLYFIAAIQDQEIRNKTSTYLLKAGAMGHLSTDLKKLIYLLESLDQKIVFTKDAEKLPTHHAFSECMELLNFNPNIIFETRVEFIRTEQRLNTIYRDFKVLNPLKTAILLNSPELLLFFIEIKKKQKPEVNPVNLKISNHFNLIDYLMVTPDCNKEIFDLIIKENPLISDYLLYATDDVNEEISEEIYNLYVEQNGENKADFLENMENPCIKRLLLPKNYLSINPQTMAFDPLTQEIENSLKELFLLIEKNENLDQNEIFLHEAKSLVSIITNPKHLNIQQQTIEYFLTYEGYVHSHTYETLLSAAINKQSLSLIKLLVEAGANVNQSITNTNAFQAVSPLYYAALKKDAEIVSYLIKQGAKITHEILNNIHNFEPEIQEVLKSAMINEDASRKRERTESHPLEEGLPHKRIRTEKEEIQFKE